MQLSPNEVRDEFDRVQNNKYSHLLKRVRLKKVRGFIDQTVEFKYPVTALIGTNGGGKSTILGAAAMYSKRTKPRQYFPKAFVGDDSMSDWVIEIEFVDRSQSNDKVLTRTARFSEARWRRPDFPDRPVQYIEIQRTVPASEVSRFRQFLANGDIAEYSVSELPESTIYYATAVLDKDIKHYKLVQSRSNPAACMYVGSTDDGTGYSQFHFGAGEASVIETIDRIERSPDNSLILIEEVENGLHPVAVRLFVQYLQRAAVRKRLQIIFTTHSQDAVNELPSEAVWASINKKAWNGKLSIESLRAITGSTPNTNVVYVEDAFVKEWVENAIGRYGEGMSETTKVFAAGGYPNVVKVSQFHNENPLLPTPSVALVDGDIYDPTSGQRLPDHAMFLGDGVPESMVFDYVYEHRVTLVSLIRQRCLLSAFSEDRILQEMKTVRNGANDPHALFSRLSERLDFVSAVHIRSGMIDIYNEKNQQLWMGVVAFIRSRTSRVRTTAA